MVEEKYRKAVFIVVYRRIRNSTIKEKKEYLLLKRKKHWIGWEFPKGGLDGKEKPIETAKREIKEECGQEGFNFKRYKFSGKYNYSRPLKDRSGFIGQTYSLFSAEVKNKKVFFDKNEHSDYRWVSFARALKMLTWENQKKALKIVERKLNKPSLSKKD